MSKAHKTPCDDAFCDQFVCVTQFSEGFSKHTASFNEKIESLSKANKSLRAQLASMRAIALELHDSVIPDFMYDGRWEEIGKLLGEK